MKIGNTIVGLTACQYEHSENLLEFTGDSAALSRFKKELTITNKNIGWQINRLNTSLAYWQNLSNDYARGQVRSIQEQLETLQEQLKTCFYEETTYGVIAPAGFWFLAETIEKNWHLNTGIQPILIDGLRDYQKEAVTELLKYKRATCVMATGCHHPDQGILLFDGSVKKAKDICIGEQLMGPDSKPRVVHELVRGRDEMFKITPVKGGNPFIVNSEHILSLWITPRKRDAPGKFEEISVRDYLSKHNTYKHMAKLWRTGVDFNSTNNKGLLDPYFLGVWLGDGSLIQNSLVISNPDQEVVAFLQKYVNSNNCKLTTTVFGNKCPSHYIGSNSAKKGSNVIKEAIKYFDLASNYKRIPHEFLTASRKDRLELLAGLLDTDGYLIDNVFEIIVKDSALANDILFLARSLGFTASVRKKMSKCQTGAVGEYNRIFIFGNTENIPCKIPRKQATKRMQKKRHNVTGFGVESLGEGEFCGFVVDEDCLYLMDDFTVTHNCGKTKTFTSLCVSAVAAGKRVLVVVPSEYLIRQTVNVLKQYPLTVTGASAKIHPKLGCDVMVSTAQTSMKHIDNYDVVIIDESHHSAAKTWQNLLSFAQKAEYVYNFTATPFRSDGMELAIHAFGGPIVYERDLKWGIENGWLCDFDALCIFANTVDAQSRPIELSKDTMMQSAYKKIVGSGYFLRLVANQVQAAHAKGRRIIVMFRTLPPAKMLAKFLEKDEIVVSVASADFKKPIDDFSSGACNVLIATDKLISEGIDIPNADTLFLLTQNASDVTTYQALGRILRKSPDKIAPVLVDFVALGYEQFVNSANKRRRVYTRNAKSVKDIRL